ncbi:hypothetical protein HKI87_19g89460 [Chloropicon roscoffensis]|uniref:Uncharacterized protein n=1 Tax=Chloropicon roscoffensis TaxID=1461544 RepID=A0AAX4PNE0_9CHLO
MVSALALGKAKALKEACLEAVKESVDVAKNATDGRKVVGGNRKYGSRKEAREAKIAAAKAKRAAKELAEEQALKSSSQKKKS